jgi:hypothetical protein
MTDLDHPVEFKVSGQRFRISGREMLDRARKALARGVPPEARRYREWFVDVDAKPVGVKWLFSLATGLGTGEFDSSHARNVLRRMGIEAHSLKQTAPPLPSPTRKRRKKKPADNAERRYRLLDTEVQAIRDFLEGNAGSRPSDERLCYWVFLCLTFELYREGWQLFALIDSSQVSQTLYERTSRFARACQVRAEVQA